MIETFYELNGIIYMSLENLKAEFDIIIKNYTKEAIINKSINVRPSKNLPKYEKKELKKYIFNLYQPHLDVIYDMIDDGLIKSDGLKEETIDVSNLSDEEQELMMIYSCWDTIYMYISIKNNLILSFIMQGYLLIEREMIKYILRKFEKKCVNLFSALKYIEKQCKMKFTSELKEKINMYKDIINIYKHGEGESFNNIKENHKEILNYTIEDIDPIFIFKKDIINFDDFYSCIQLLLKELKI